MTRNAAHKVEILIKSQFEAMRELADEIRRLNATGDKEQANRLARILDRISKDSLEIGTTIRDQAA